MMGRQGSVARPCYHPQPPHHLYRVVHERPDCRRHWGPVPLLMERISRFSLAGGISPARLQNPRSTPAPVLRVADFPCDNDAPKRKALPGGTARKCRRLVGRVLLPLAPWTLTRVGSHRWPEPTCGIPLNRHPRLELLFIFPSDGAEKILLFAFCREGGELNSSRIREGPCPTCHITLDSLTG